MDMVYPVLKGTEAQSRHDTLYRVYPLLKGTEARSGHDTLYMVCPVLKENRRTIRTHFYTVLSVHGEQKHD